MFVKQVEVNPTGIFDKHDTSQLAMLSSFDLTEKAWHHEIEDKLNTNQFNCNSSADITFGERHSVNGEKSE